MKREERMRRAILEAMGWTNLHWNCFDLWGLPDGVTPDPRPEGHVMRNHPAPDPVDNARDADVLEEWLVGQGLRVDTTALKTGVLCYLWMDSPARVREGPIRSWVPASEHGIAACRRRALVEAAWQAVQAMAARA